MGNRLSKQDSAAGTENYSYNAANMLLSRAGNPYSSDAAGNMLAGGGRTNTWDSQNRLIQCVNGITTSSFVYGEDGIRHQTTVNGSTKDFVVDSSMFVQERNHSTRANVATYLVGARGPEYRRDDVTGQVRWYVYDGLGSVLGEVDPTGNITSSREYDVYGLVRGGNNPVGTSSHKFVGQLGHPSEDNTGLIYMQARYYDPITGRFVKEDSKNDGYNLFSYCDNNPVNNVDPDGKSKVRLDLFTAGAITAGVAIAYCFIAALTNSLGVLVLAIIMATVAAAFFLAAFLGGGDVYKVSSGACAFGGGLLEKLLEPTFKNMISAMMAGYKEASKAPMISGVFKQVSCLHTRSGRCISSGRVRQLGA